MKLVIFPLLCTRSRRAIRRTKGKFGHVYSYTPRADLVIRLSTKLGMTREDVLDQIQKEREYIIKLHESR